MLEKYIFLVEDAFVENRNNQEVSGPFPTLDYANKHIEKVLKPPITRQMRGEKFYKFALSVILFDKDNTQEMNRLDEVIEQLKSERDGLYSVWHE